MLCYCGSLSAYAECCRPFIIQLKQPETCEQLMRSRYSAYCIKNADYIYMTYHPTQRLANSIQQIADFANNSHFIKLDIMASQQTDNQGSVRFSVSYLQNNLLFEFLETSEFIFEDSWLYTTGRLIESPTLKVGRNDKCPCGSNKKFKQCVEHLPSGSQG